MALLLEWLAARAGERAEEWRAWAGRVGAAVAHVRAAGPHTPDMGGAATTADLTRAVIDALGAA